MTVLALAPETVSSIALLLLSLGVLVAGVVVGKWLSTAANSVVRFAFPLIAAATLSAFGVLVYFARINR
ncbi:MAG TPA: hypothetical protein VNG13_03665 [Mycobacteriales bacterium]|nr:hypothetical protein [Mycobacteriales bacterium]